MTSPSMPYDNDSSGITAFTIMMLPIDQIISCIGFLIIMRARFVIRQGEDVVFYKKIKMMKKNKYGRWREGVELLVIILILLINSQIEISNCKLSLVSTSEILTSRIYRQN